MIQETKQIYFKDFKRVNESLETSKLPPEELAELENIRLDEELGVASVRGGFSRYHNEADSTGKINNLYDVIDKDDNNYLLAAIGTKLRKSLNGTSAYSDVKTSLTESKLRMAVFGNKFYFTNNNEKPFYSDLTDTYDFEIARPDISGSTIAYNGSGGTLRVTSWLIVFITEDGQASNASNKLTYYGGINAVNFTLNDLPISADTRITSKKIYRTKDLVLSDFYLVATIDNSATSYIDTVSDDSLNSAETFKYLNFPLKSKFIETNNDRLFLANIQKYATNRVIPPEQYNNTMTYVFDDTTAGNMDAGVYKYGWSLVDQNGNESEMIEAFSYTLGSGSKRLDFYIFPTAMTNYTDLTDSSTFSYNESIKYIRIYRTKVGGSIYYWVQDYEQPFVASGEFTGVTYDDKNDTSLTESYPKSAHYSTELLKLKSTIVFSNLQLPLEWAETNLIEIYPDDGDEITRIKDDNNGILIFKTNSICKLFTLGDPTSWYVKKLVENIGCDEPDSVYKYQGAYFHTYQKRTYLFDGAASKNISETRKNTFDSITSINDASFWHKGLWYILSVIISGKYYLLCYDLKLEGWYKFSVNKADALTLKQHGTDSGIMLVGGDTYVTYYDETALQDTDSGSTKDIGTLLKTGGRSIDDFVNMRLVQEFINYYRRIGTTGQNITFMLTDPMLDKSITYSESLDVTSAGVHRVEKNTFYIMTDKLGGSLKRARKINLEISGAALKKFHSLRLDYWPEVWGVERRYSDASGFGMLIGSKVGVNE